MLGKIIKWVVKMNKVTFLDAIFYNILDGNVLRCYTFKKNYNYY